MEKTVRDAAAAMTVGEFVKVMISGDLAKGIAIACKTIQPISRVEVRASEVLQSGTVPEPAPVPVEAPPQPGEMPVAGGAAAGGEGAEENRTEQLQSHNRSR